jgi:hypothetical protein
MHNESVQEYLAELKRLYDKGFPFMTILSGSIFRFDDVCGWSLFVVFLDVGGVLFCICLETYTAGHVKNG